MLNGFSPVCNSSIATGRFPQVSGLKLTFTCNGTTPVVTGMWKTASGTDVPIGPTDTVRFVTNDFMYLLGGRLGYTFSQGGIDYVLFYANGIKPWLVLVVGPIWFVLYFAVFYGLIKVFNMTASGSTSVGRSCQRTWK